MKDTQYGNAIRSLENQNLKYKNYIDKKKIRDIKSLSRKCLEFFRSYRKRTQYKKTIELHVEENMNLQMLEECLYSENEIKIAVYTCISGDYDELIEPKFEHYNIDYFLFSDHIKESRHWNIIRIPVEIKKKFSNNNTLVNRYLKLHPYEFFEQYDYVIYIDGNIEVISDLTGLTKLIGTNGIAMHKHYQRESIYTEAEALFAMKKGNHSKIKKQIEKYKSKKFPDNYGLCEATIILSDPKNQISKKIFDNWWKEFHESQSMRDQLSIPFVLWEMGIPVQEITRLGNNLRNSSKFNFISHKNR